MVEVDIGGDAVFIEACDNVCGGVVCGSDVSAILPYIEPTKHL